MATARNQVAVTKSDATVYTPPLDALYVGGAGDVVTKDKDGTSATYTVTAGGYVLCQCTQVMSTGTTATGIVGLVF